MPLINFPSRSPRSRLRNLSWAHIVSIVRAGDTSYTITFDRDIINFIPGVTFLGGLEMVDVQTEGQDPAHGGSAPTLIDQRSILWTHGDDPPPGTAWVYRHDDNASSLAFAYSVLATGSGIVG